MNPHNSISDTIAALATAPGESSIAVIRVSGEKAFDITSQIFYKDNTAKNNFDISSLTSHTIHFGYIFNGDELIDEVVVSVFRSPHSYTGEDVIEISTHGGNFISSKVMGILLENGCRHAEPGEYTKRAFLNGRIDLSQAEAVADLIKSKTDRAHKFSIKQIEGSLSEFVKNSRNELIHLTGLVELELDFAEEGLEFVQKDKLKKGITDLRNTIENIISSYRSGRFIRDGINLVIAGRPNSGKSSLFNYFLKTNRAIVSDIAGTTRDYIEESLIINGIQFNIIDTAGLRLTEDVLESEGIKRSHEKIADADLIVYLIDSSQSTAEMDSSVKYYSEYVEGKNSLLVFTKDDKVIDSHAFMRNIILLMNKYTIKGDIKGTSYAHDFKLISLLKDETIEALKTTMITKVIKDEISASSNDIILTNNRHRICLENTVISLDNAIASLDDNMSGEFISLDLRNAMKALGELIGEISNDDILNEVFSKFCIGK
ncbi:tRNA uridine-5-carboxymethylaminomethyl(34) synthesis GTPase MnmE [soil metagenome]